MQRWSVIALGLGLLTTAGHAAASGAPPHAGGLAAVALVSAALAVPLGHRRRRVLSLAAWLVAAQGLGHVVLAVTDGHGHGHGLLPGPGMLAAHAAAAVGVAAVVAWADDLVSAWRALARTLAGAAVVAPAGVPAPPSAGAIDVQPAHLRSPHRTHGRAWHRGPPTPAALALP